MYALIVFILVLTPMPEHAAAFRDHLRLAGAAQGRVERVRHLKAALELRPDHPQNIVLEFRIGIALSQHGDPATGTSPNPADGLPWFERILAKYDHMDYYEARASTGSWDAQFMVPRAASYLAGLMARSPASEEKRRQVLLDAMEAIKQTYHRRIKDWLSEPRPSTVEELRERNPLLLKAGGARDAETRVTGRMNLWKSRRAAALRGDVLHDVELRTVDSLVRQYGYISARQELPAVEQAMQTIIERFPDTPMSKVAQEHVNRAKAAELEQDLS